MKVFFDIITNHTADVIDYQGGQYAYVDKATEPYGRRRQRLRRRATTPAATRFPALDAADVVPLHAGLPHRGRRDRQGARPGSTTRRCTTTAATRPSPASPATYGDFFGLDDLFTEQPEVVDGHDRHLQDVGRLRHRRLPHRHRQARQHGVLAEVLAGDPRARGQGRRQEATSSCSARSTTATRRSCRQYTTTGKLPATLDFGFQGSALGFAQGKPTTEPARLLRRRRLLHRHRLQRLRAADLPRQPRHGPRSA